MPVPLAEGLRIREASSSHAVSLVRARASNDRQGVAPPQVTFLVAGITRVNQPQFWNIDPNSDDLANFKMQNYKGTYADFNLFTTMLQNSVLGCAQIR